MVGTPRTDTCLFDFDDLEIVSPVKEYDSSPTAEEPAICDPVASPVAKQPSRGGRFLAGSQRAAAGKGQQATAALQGSRRGRRRESCCHFLTFGNDAYAVSAVRIAREVSALGNDLFPEKHVFTELPPEVATDERWRRHISEGGKGYGWCFWKPVLVNHLLEEGHLQDNDIIAYGDAGCTVNPGSRDAWRQLLDRVSEPNGVDMVAFHNDQLENRRTKGDTFAHFNKHWDCEDYALTCQLVGGYWLARVNARTRSLFQAWEELCAEVHLISDDPSRTENPFFIENRHDQSLLSMLVKCNAPRFVRAGAQHLNAGRLGDAVATCWRSPGFARDPEFGIEGLQIVILQDCGWPVTGEPGQAIAATRISSHFLMSEEDYGD